MRECQVELIQNVLQELLVGLFVVGSPDRRQTGRQSHSPEDAERCTAIEPSQINRGLDFPVPGVEEVLGTF